MVIYLCFIPPNLVGYFFYILILENYINKDKIKHDKVEKIK